MNFVTFVTISDKCRISQIKYNTLTFFVNEILAFYFSRNKKLIPLRERAFGGFVFYSKDYF